MGTGFPGSHWGDSLRRYGRCSATWKIPLFFMESHSDCLISMSACQAIWNTRKGAFVGPAGKNWFHHTTFLARGSYWCTGLITGIHWMVHEWWLLLFTLIIIICYSLFIYEFLINWAIKPLSVVTIANGVSHSHKFTLKKQFGKKRKENLVLTSTSFCTYMTLRVYLHYALWTMPECAFDYHNIS